jgi:aspartyl/asparaginyl beta-hydroxylase (cupin superfamily)
VLLFDDSFEHDAHNDTDAPRLVLIVDLWHPGIGSDEARLQLLDRPQALRYARAVELGAFENTTQRGH